MTGNEPRHWRNLDAAAAGVVSGVAGDGEDGDAFTAGQAAERDGGVVSVEHGHLHVEEHDGVHGGRDCGRRAPGWSPEGLAVGGVVVHDEHHRALLDETFDGADEAAGCCVACRA
ncbi:MAG: hypothetical protein IPO67_23110 [Deltaproteobacteria bacterium]|nr:hypothetical protein [Deltaproteobacteria bacterium]